ncbi:MULTISPECIES: heme ABC transporter substrate-binding protein IsdE [unclassified Enterococcus]|uniref:heme ABC transporter substrate-binding protein IsdE n=1 Tax=unclassified Enterococcus TaxID=2608891 RepID=UPI001551C74B|nr:MULTISPECIES: heme ABC transporter substrate-binding protein IsdE [unclassified Enterococcus]MBS7578252.1 heme ABC transporter substrate-binding protein IsdE [Enterococcus sp. MMGLQ5-2]MBS7585509.1 heme ABC transporter substrate-binding protein IsdE [Enterococcus sp. MMGLQ5-1]NPD13368.1 heme ABC transporter substrate-binding protein IsdE [Enterococcus sp. MMGLQ5-1]NPD38083.1 heme ABC transporter substrate-binding protein IsdE [Enterococcus sp. MMGLQ5-2]
MRRRLCFLLICLLCPLLIACTAKSQEAAEAKVDTSSVTNKRIIATTVAITNIFAKLDLDLVGVPETSTTLPKQYQEITTVGGPMNPDLEMITSLKPDMVYGTKTLESEQKANYQAANIPASFLDFTSISSMLDEINKLGAEYNRTIEALNLVDGLKKQMDDAKAKIPAGEKPKVLILMGIPGSYLVCTENSFLGNLVREAGGVNIVQGEKVEYLASNTEYLQQANPDIILRAAHGMPAEVVEMFNQEFKTNAIWQHFSAVKNGKVYDLDSEYFGMTANLDSITAFEKLISIMYKE